MLHLMLHFRYTAWAEGEPNDSGDGEDCAVLFDMYMGEQLERFSLSKCIQKRNDFLSSDQNGSTLPVRRPICPKWASTQSTPCVRPRFRQKWKKKENNNKGLFTIYKSLCVSKWTRDINRVEVFVRPLFWCFPGASPTLLSKESLLPILDQLPTGDQHKTWSWENFLD